MTRLLPDAHVLSDVISDLRNVGVLVAQARSHDVSGVAQLRQDLHGQSIEALAQHWEQVPGELAMLAAALQEAVPALQRYQAAMDVCQDHLNRLQHDAALHGMTIDGLSLQAVIDPAHAAANLTLAAGFRRRHSALTGEIHEAERALSGVAVFGAGLIG